MITRSETVILLANLDSDDETPESFCAVLPGTYHVVRAKLRTTKFEAWMIQDSQIPV